MSIPRLKVGHYIDRTCVALLGSPESLEKLPLCDFHGLKLEA
jgi:hypothetical protein